MKKVLFLAPSLGIGGMERVLITIANKLSENGYDVTVMTLNPDMSLADKLSPKVKVCRKPYKEHFGNRIPYIRHKFYDDGMWETRASAKTLYKYYVGDEKYDVEIAFFRGLCIKIISGSVNKNAAHLAWVHSDFLKCKGIGNNFKSFDDVKKAYNMFDSIVCVSKQARESFTEKIGRSENVYTIYNPLPVNEILELKEKECPLKKDRFTIMSVGHLLPVKGYDRLLAATKKLCDDGFCFDLWIIGFGKEQENLEKYISENDLTNVKLLTNKENPYAYMREADLYVCSSRYEGYNLAVAEALLCGMSVISTDCTGPSEILDKGKYGMIVENSEEGLYNGLKCLLNNKEKLQEYKKLTEERKSFFDVDVIIRQIIDLFNSGREK
ncbi:MAG: glycosyltransferase [Clostridia bacterium]|nr:glycosyltransferase [Clostridia bacterium]